MEIEYRLIDGAYPPTKAHDADAGFDLKVPDGVTVEIYPGKRAAIDTKVQIKIPKGYCGLMVAKSGLNVRNGITSTGLIDADYTGTIVVELYNHGNNRKVFHGGDKISQLMILPVPEVEMVRREEPFDVGEGERGANGFGSSGAK